VNAPLRLWAFAFLVTTLMAGALLVAAVHPAPAPVVPRDPAKLAAVDAELLLNRIREGDLVAIKGDVDAARGLWDAARKKGAGYWPIHEAVGDSFARHRLDEEADREYETAARLAGVQLQQVPVGLLVKRSDALIRLNRPEPALRLLIECAEPDRLAGAMARILDKSPGLMEIIKANADGRDPRLWRIVAVLSKDPAERANALGRFSRAVAPWNGPVARQAIEELRKVRRLEEAILVCRDWAKAAPRELAAYESWGEILIEMGRPDEARLAFTTMVDVRPGDAEAHRRLGASLRKLDLFAEAMQQLEEAAKLVPEDPLSMQEMILVLVAQGNLEAATARYRTLTSRSWESRFGNVTAAFKSRLAEECARLNESERRTKGVEAARRSRKFCADLGIAEAGIFDLKVIMKWDAESDVDLDVAEPGGEVINHGNARSKLGGIYHFDNTRGRGPEHYTLPLAPKGTYSVGAHLHGSTRSEVEIEVILFEDTPRERRIRDRFVLDKATTHRRALEFTVP